MCFQDLGKKRREKEEEAVGQDFELWSSKRGEILARFTTTERLSIVSPPPHNSKFLWFSKQKPNSDFFLFIEPFHGFGPR